MVPVACVQIRGVSATQGSGLEGFHCTYICICIRMWSHQRHSHQCDKVQVRIVKTQWSAQERHHHHRTGLHTTTTIQDYVPPPPPYRTTHHHHRTGLHTTTTTVQNYTPQPPYRTTHHNHRTEHTTTVQNTPPPYRTHHHCIGLHTSDIFLLRYVCMYVNSIHSFTYSKTCIQDHSRDQVFVVSVDRWRSCRGAIALMKWFTNQLTVVTTDRWSSYSGGLQGRLHWIHSFNCHTVENPSTDSCFIQ